MHLRGENIDAGFEEDVFVVAGDVVNFHALGKDLSPAEIARAGVNLLCGAEEDELAIIRAKFVVVDGNAVDVFRNEGSVRSPSLWPRLLLRRTMRVQSFSAM